MNFLKVHDDFGQFNNMCMYSCFFFIIIYFPRFTNALNNIIIRHNLHALLSLLTIRQQIIKLNARLRTFGDFGLRLYSG